MKAREMCGPVALLALVLGAWCGGPGAAAAGQGLLRAGPLSPTHGFPLWYQDKSGLALEFGAPLNQAELAGGWCLILPEDVPGGLAPELFPARFAVEHFYWSCNGLIPFALPDGSPSRALLVLGLEASFAADVPVAGDQIAFGRLRIRIDDLPHSGTYTAYTPYGVFTFPDQVAGDRLFFTSDIGIDRPFDGALTSDLGPFLLPSDTPGGAELPAVAGPAAGKLYIADPARLGPVTGSPLPPFTSALDGVTRDANRFRIEGPAGFVLETTDFALTGRIFTDAMPGQVTISAAEYSKTLTTGKVDVTATALPSLPGRLPASPPPAPVIPELVCYNAAPVVNATTKALSAPVGVSSIPMARAGTAYWVQSQPAVIPAAVCVQDVNARNAAGQTLSTFYSAKVTDHVTVTEALFNPAGGGSLTVRAFSSDRAVPRALTLEGYGLLANNEILVSPLAAPPATVRVTSAAGGSGERRVSVTAAAAGGVGAPVAAPDSAATDEDTPLSIPVLANDTFNGAAVAAGAGVAITLVGASKLGTASVGADGLIAFAPYPNVFGEDGISYTLTVNGAASSSAYVGLLVRPVNDPPVAADDAVVIAVGLRSLDVLSNDDDADGQADLADAVIETAPDGASVTGGPTVQIAAAAPGIYRFTYRARDASGALSARAAAVTVDAREEAIAVGGALFRTAQRRWIVTGTDSVPLLQTLTVAYADGTLADGTPAAGTVVGTATVDALGVWSLDFLDAGGTRVPSDAAAFSAAPTQLRVTSPLGGVAVVPFLVRN